MLLLILKLWSLLLIGLVLFTLYKWYLKKYTFAKNKNDKILKASFIINEKKKYYFVASKSLH